MDVEESDKSTSYVFLFLVQGEGEFRIMNEFRFQLLSASLESSNKDAKGSIHRQQVSEEGINSMHSFETQQRVTFV